MTQKNTGFEPMPPEEKEIDRMLEELAGDVPEMPADFHENWMKAVREEAGKRQGSVSQWPRILSVAAVFVLLVGGVLLARNTGKTPEAQAPRTEAAMKAAEEPEAAEAQASGSAEEGKADIPEREDAFESAEDAGSAPQMNATLMQPATTAMPTATAALKADAEEEMAAPLMAAGYETNAAAEEEAEEMFAAEAYEADLAAEEETEDTDRIEEFALKIAEGILRMKKGQ